MKTGEELTGRKCRHCGADEVRVWRRDSIDSGGEECWDVSEECSRFGQFCGKELDPDIPDDVLNSMAMEWGLTKENLEQMVSETNALIARLSKERDERLKRSGK